MTLSNLSLLCCCVAVIMLITKEVHSQNPFYCQDSSGADCDIIKPHHCYDFRTRNLCCASCRRWEKQSQFGCEYGDRLVVWRNEFGRYTCKSYITFFSDYNCRRNSEFQRDCCQSCMEARHPGGDN